MKKSPHGTGPPSAKGHSMLDFSLSPPVPFLEISSHGHFMVRIAVINYFSIISSFARPGSLLASSG
jgi:hypothetical protein